MADQIASVISVRLQACLRHQIQETARFVSGTSEEGPNNVASVVPQRRPQEGLWVAPGTPGFSTVVPFRKYPAPKLGSIRTPGVPISTLAPSRWLQTAEWMAGFLSRQNNYSPQLMACLGTIGPSLPPHCFLLLAVLCFPCCSVCGNEYIKATWSHSFWVPVSFLSSLFPRTLILIVCFFLVTFFSILKGEEASLGFCARWNVCLKAAGAVMSPMQPWVM